MATPPAFPEHGMMDSLFDFRIARIRILSGLGNDALGYLLKKGDITDAEFRAALEKSIPGRRFLYTCRIHRPTSDKKGQ